MVKSTHRFTSSRYLFPPDSAADAFVRRLLPVGFARRGGTTR